MAPPLTAGVRGHKEVVRTLNRLGAERVGRRKYNRLEGVCRSIYSEALKGSISHQTLLFHYIAGKPKETVDVNVGVSEMTIKLIRLIGQGAFDGREEEIDALTIEHNPAEGE